MNYRAIWRMRLRGDSGALIPGPICWNAVTCPDSSACTRGDRSLGGAYMFARESYECLLPLPEGGGQFWGSSLQRGKS